MATALDRDIAAALQTPGTARERLGAFFALDPSGRRGAPALRERQQKAQLRLRALDARRNPSSAAARGSADYSWARDPRAAYYLHQHECRSAAREERLRAAKSARRAKIRSRLAARYTVEVARRGGEIDIEGQYGTEILGCTDHRGSNGRETCVLHCSGWRQYSRAYGAARASLSYLCGVDDSGRWAVRIPGTITTVDDAIAYLEPAAVRSARERGKRVQRQGDVYAVETARQHDGLGADDLDRHDWHSRARVLLHPEHVPMSVAFPARFVTQRALRMGRGAGHGCGD